MADQYYRGIQLADKEFVLREYFVGIQRRPKVNIFLAVTNRKVLKVGEYKRMTGRSSSISEVHINDIAGINAFLGGGLNIIELIFGIILFLVGLLIAIMGNYSPMFLIVGIVILLIGIVLIVLSLRKKALILEVDSKSSMSKPISIYGISSRHINLGALGLKGNMYIKPGPDAEKVIAELSACILDMQSDPENAIKKWGVTNVAPSYGMENR